jgi:glutamine synthetase
MIRRVIADYIFLDGDGKFRTKNRVVTMAGSVISLSDFSVDGSSTGQASETGNTEVILRPVYHTKNPLRSIESYLVLCETYDAVTDEPLPSNTRAAASKFFELEEVANMDIWFGPEQEYYFQPRSRAISYCHPTRGAHYCGIRVDPTQQNIVDKHFEVCMVAGLNFYGTNAEVSLNQWEFQLGPSPGIIAADHLIIARFLLEKIASNYGYAVFFEPKPFNNRNGSGCHINFSTKLTRSPDGGADEILKLMPAFESTHADHIAVYGKGNEERLTGKCETAPIGTFSYGIGTRNTSMRISNQVMKDGCGYVEDRRPAANVDPYLAMMRIVQTIIKET